MDITTEVGAFFDIHPRLKNKALLLDITIVNPCAGSNLGNAARHVGKHLADAVERKKNKYRGSFPATYSLLPLAMSTCGDVGSDVLCPHQGARHQTGTAEVGDIPQRVPTSGGRDRRSTSSAAILCLFYSRHSHSARITISADRGWRLRAPDSPIRKARRLYKRIVPGGVTGSEGQEGANGTGGGIGVGGGNGDGNGDVNGLEDGDGAGTGVEVNEGAQDGNGDGSGDGDGAGAGTGVGTRRRTPDGNGDGNGDGSEDSSGDGNGDDDNGRNENRIGEGGREAKKRKKPQNSCRRRAENGRDLVGKGKQCSKERVGSVAANPDNLESNKEAGGGAQGTQGSSKSGTSRESVSSLSRLIRGFRNKYH